MTTIPWPWAQVRFSPRQSNRIPAFLRIWAAVACPRYTMLPFAPEFRQAVTTRLGVRPSSAALAPVPAARSTTTPNFIAFLPPPVQAEEGVESGHGRKRVTRYGNCVQEGGLQVKRVALTGRCPSRDTVLRQGLSRTAQLLLEPCLGELPVASDRSRRTPQYFGGFFLGHASEIAQFHDLTAGRDLSEGEIRASSRARMKGRARPTEDGVIHVDFTISGG